MCLKYLNLEAGRAYEHGAYVNKPGRVIQRVSPAEIVIFGGFSLAVMEGYMDGQMDIGMDGRTD